MFSIHSSHCLIDTPSGNPTDLSGLSCPNQKSSSLLSCLPPLPIIYFFFFFLRKNPLSVQVPRQQPSSPVISVFHPICSLDTPSCLFLFFFLPSAPWLTAHLPFLVYDYSHFPASLSPSPFSLFLHMAARRSVLKCSSSWPLLLTLSSISSHSSTGERQLAHAASPCSPFCLPCQSSSLRCVSPILSERLWSLCFVALQLT